MKKFTEAVKTKHQKAKSKQVTNYMGGNSYGLNPLDTLRIVTASSIFGEPAYYRNGEFDSATIRETAFMPDRLFAKYDVFDGKFKGMKTSNIMIQVINDALNHDFAATLDWAVSLRKDYYMRLNPQVIMVEAAKHEGRSEFTKNNPGEFNRINQIVMSRADEPASQFTYYLFQNGGSKKNLPNILKKSWANKLNSLNGYAVSKYKNHAIGMINTVRVSHASSDVLDELMKTGNVKLESNYKTWENLRSEGKTWPEILDTITIGHMALLRNLRNIFSETIARSDAVKLLDTLKAGVLKGKQFPFRYWSAYKAIENAPVNQKVLVLDTLEECIDIALDNMPKLKGKTMCLSDNSGSAWDAFNSSYGTVTVAEIGNLSSLITARNSDEGYVGVFGDKLKSIPVSKRNGTLNALKEVTRVGKQQGMGTENGIWLFFKQAIANKEHWDNIFIYSDMQAGHGGLYGLNSSNYREFAIGSWGRHIDVMKLVEKYRSEVNSKVNVFSVQTAGYENVLLPEYAYRANVLTGWTGKELVFAAEMNDFWDMKDAQKAQAKLEQ